MIKAKGKIKDLEKLSGKWVALVDGRVVEYADNLSQLMMKVRSKRFANKPSVMLVPRKDEGPYVLIVLL